MTLGFIPENTTRLPAEQEYELTVRRMFATVELSVLDVLPRLQRLRVVNGLDVLVAATAEGERVGTSTMTKERLLDVLALLDSFQTWANTALAGRPSRTPLIILSQRD